MPTTGIFNGTNLILKFHSTDGSEVVVGHTTSASMSLSADLPDATTKNSSGYNEVIAGTRTGEISFEGLVAYDDSNNAIEAADYLLARTKVYWTFGTSVSGDDVYSGAGFLNSVEMSAEMESPVSFSGSITVTGAIAKTAN